MPLGRGVVTVSASDGAACMATIASNGLGSCSLVAHGAGTLTLDASYAAQIGFRASTAEPFAYDVSANDTIFRNGFEGVN